MRKYSQINIFILAVTVLLSLSIDIISCHPKKLKTLETGVWISVQGAYDADLSPDGKYLVFTDSMIGRNWKEDLYLYSVQTGERTIMHQNTFWDGEARWSPDGKQIVFTTDMLGLKNLSLYSYSDSSVREITTGGACHPCWSPSGKQVVFVSDRTRYPELWILDIEGLTLRQITNFEEDVATPAWAPDNSRIIFCLKKGSQWDLWQIPLPNGNPSPLFQTVQNECYPRWSKSGKYLTFCSFMPDAKQDVQSCKIWVTKNEAGRFPTEVVKVLETDEPGHKLFYPSFTVDEKFIIFSSNQAEYRWDTGFIDLSKKLKPEKENQY